MNSVLIICAFTISLMFSSGAHVQHVAQHPPPSGELRLSAVNGGLVEKHTCAYTLSDGAGSWSADCESIREEAIQYNELGLLCKLRDGHNVYKFNNEGCKQ